jgi:hypothetical protein
LLAQERVGDRAPEDVLARIFEGTSADYVHVRNGEAGCFMAKVISTLAELRTEAPPPPG